MDILEELFRHNSWATQQLLEHCAALPPETLEKTAPGTYGSIIATLRHLSGAEERYLHRAEGTPRREEVMEKAELGLDELRREAVGRAERWQRLLATAPDPDRVIVSKQPDGTEIRIAVKTLLVQAVHHGNDHRTHICTVLGSHGLQVPDLDAWAFYRED